MAKAMYLEAGKIVNTHGIKGEVRLEAWCDSPEALCAIHTLYYDAAGTRPVSVSVRPQKGMALVKLDGIDTVQDASALRGTVLYVARADMPLKPGQHFICDLIGLPVTDAETGIVYGTVTDVFNTGANDIYTVKKPGGGVSYVPAVASVVREIDPDAGWIKIIPITGLFDDEI